MQEKETGWNIGKNKFNVESSISFDLQTLPKQLHPLHGLQPAPKPHLPQLQPAPIPPPNEDNWTGCEA